MRLEFSKVFKSNVLCAPGFWQLKKGPSTCAPNIAAPCSLPWQRFNLGKI